MIAPYVIFYGLTALGFTFFSWLGLLWHRQRKKPSRRSLIIGLASGPLSCLFLFGGWLLFNLVTTPRGDPPIGAGVSMLIGGPVFLFTIVLVGIMGYF